jgi:hypothetical protein
MKLVQLYKQVKEENEKLGKILVPRRSKEERETNYLVATNKKVQEYIKNGSKGNLDLGGTPITSLPDNLTYVDGYLDLIESKITSLPDNLTKIGDWLDLSRTPITSLPKNLIVGNWCSLKFSKITNLPENLTIKGSLLLQYTQITSLPNNLTVEGNLNVSNTPLSKQYTEEQIKQMVPGADWYTV